MSPENSVARIFDTDRTVRLGVWGLGRGLDIIKTAQAVNVEVVAGCDYNPHFLDKFRAAIPQGRFTADADEFLGWDFDAVLIATYCPAHAAHAIQALQAGKHVLSEVTAFHTVAEGVALVEAVEETRLIYQFAENYPYTPTNRFLARKWAEGIFGDLMYGEYSYMHDCLGLAFTYIDGSPVQPEHCPHSWRSWLPWHYYNTHSLGPVLYITGERPAQVTAFGGGPRMPGHLMLAPSGLGGMAPSLIEMESGAIMRNLMGGTTDDTNYQRLIGTRGSSDWAHGKLQLRLGGRGRSPKLEVTPDDDEIGKLAASSGHGGGDFWTLYHFANEILFGQKGGFDVYQAADQTLPGIQAYRSAIEGGRPQEAPDLRKADVRDRWRSDDFAPARLDTRAGVFGGAEPKGEAKNFNSVMKDLLQAADLWQGFFGWHPLHANLSNKMPILEAGYRALEQADLFARAVQRASAICEAYPDAPGGMALREVLQRIDAEAVLEGRGPSLLQKAIDELIEAATPESGLFPQLEMRREGLADLPEPQLPDGYTLRAYQEGDSDHWRAIIGASFRQEQSEDSFRRSMLYRPDADLSRIHFACDPSGRPVATATAYGDNETGYVHYVGAVPESAGQGLGRAVSLAVLRHMRQRGCQAARLHTDDWRHPAIKTYWRLGFRPHLTHRSHPDRWRIARRNLKLED